MVRPLFIQIVKGVRDMHKSGVVHRDLKQTNIFLSKTVAGATPRIKVGDFGLACKLYSNEQICKKAGTFGYMAPEIFLH